MFPRYETGEPVHIGDAVECDGMIGNIVFVIEQREFSSEFPESQWSYLEHGFMFRSDEGILIHYDKFDECCLRLLARRQP